METVPSDVLAAYGFGNAKVTPIAIGLINRTWRVDAATGSFVLQRLHPIFTGEVNLDIEAITDRLAAEGLETPRLVRTVDDEAWVHGAPDDAVYRVLTWIDGRTVEKVREPATAGAAARLVARFHRALLAFDHEFHFTRPGAHDTPKHLATLREALETHADHPSFPAVAPIGEGILAHAENLPAIPSLPARIIHGDLKISNVLFTEDLTSAIALVDLDTMARSTLAIELGDALRSWCNPAGEESPGRVDEDVFDAAIRGYAEAAEGFLTPEEIASIVPGFETISLELAARFCADALNESYFGWDPDRFSSRSEHNRVRATSQLGLANAIEARRSALIERTEGAFSR